MYRIVIIFYIVYIHQLQINWTKINDRNGTNSYIPVDKFISAANGIIEKRKEKKMRLIKKNKIKKNINGYVTLQDDTTLTLWHNYIYMCVKQF